MGHVIKPECSLADPVKLCARSATRPVCCKASQCMCTCTAEAARSTMRCVPPLPPPSPSPAPDILHDRIAQRSQGCKRSRATALSLNAILRMPAEAVQSTALETAQAQRHKVERTIQEAAQRGEEVTQAVQGGTDGKRDSPCKCLSCTAPAAAAQDEALASVRQQEVALPELEARPASMSCTAGDRSKMGVRVHVSAVGHWRIVAAYQGTRKLTASKGRAAWAALHSTCKVASSRGAQWGWGPGAGAGEAMHAGLPDVPMTVESRCSGVSSWQAGAGMTLHQAPQSRQPSAESTSPFAGRRGYECASGPT